MRTPIALPTLIACLLLLALPAAPARASASDDRIIHDCQHSATGALTGSYTRAQLNHALNNLPSDVAEYSGCFDAIKQAITATAGGGGDGGGKGAGGGGSGGGTGGGGGSGGVGSVDASGGTAGAGTGAPAAPVTNAPPPAGAERPLDVAGAAVAPGALPEIGKDAHRLPTPLLVLLVLLAVAALVPACLTIGRRVVAARRA